MKKPTLKFKPNHYELTKLMSKFENGSPLVSEQLNFLYRHQRALSSSSLDPVLRYYLSSQGKAHSFLLPHDELSRNDVKHLYKRLLAFLDKNIPRLHFTMTAAQFEQIKQFTLSEIIFYHGNQYLTGAPFYPGGLPHVIYFQWGNLFGIVKYAVIPGELAIKGNLLIEFENRYERSLEACVQYYIEQHKLEYLPKQQEERQLDVQVQPQFQPQQQSQPQQQAPQLSSVYQIPKLTLARNTKREDESAL